MGGCAVGPHCTHLPTAHTSPFPTAHASTAHTHSHSSLHMPPQMAESCNLSSLCLSFCYKVTPQACEVIVSLLRAKGSLVKLEAMGLSVSPLAMEMLASTSSLATLDLCGVPAMNDDMVKMVSVF